MACPEAPWNAPAHLWGLPYTNPRKRTGFDLRGTLADCVTRWLSLPGHDRQNCEMSCPAAGGDVWQPERIGAYVRRHGLPPAMAAARGGQPALDALARITAIARYEPTPSALKPAGDAAHICEGYKGPSLQGLPKSTSGSK